MPITRLSSARRARSYSDNRPAQNCSRPRRPRAVRDERARAPADGSANTGAPRRARRATAGAQVAKHHASQLARNVDVLRTRRATPCG